MTVQRKYFKGTLATFKVLGSEIREARKKRGYSEEALASRVKCSRDTIRAIEAGKPTVEIGLFFEAAAHVGIVIFDTAQALDERLDAIRAELKS
jgi:DNA-binding XRE family transcriptional regulator